MEKYQDSVKLKLSKAGSFVLDLDELWSKLKSTFSPDGYHEHKRDIEEHGARIASKFVTLSHHDDYTEKRLWDAAARMSEVHKPCAAIYPEFDSTKRISRLLIGFNENISAKERSALVNIWSKIKDASIDSTTSNKLLLLSDVINLQEYKVVYNSAKLASLLRDIAVDQDLKIEPLLTKLMDYQAKIETYSKEHTKDFRDNSDLVFWNDINEIEDLIDEALEMDQELIKEIPEWVLKHDTKEQSISFIKLYFLLHKIMVDNIELVKLNSNINTEFELLSVAGDVQCQQIQ